MRTKVPMLMFTVITILFFVMWRSTAAPFHLWLSGAAAGLLLFCLGAEAIGLILGKPIWLTTKEDK